MKKINFSLIILIFIPFLFISNSVERNNFIKNIIDFNNLENLDFFVTKYMIRGSSKNATEIIKYSINYNNRKNFIDITETAKGSFCDSFYETSFNYNLIEGFTKTTYFSEPENRNYSEIYEYYKNTLVYKEIYKNKTKKYSLNQFSGDSIRLMEILTFAKLEKLKKIEAVGFIVPGAFKIPFIFKFIKEDTIIVNGKKYNCLLFSGEINGILSGPAKLLFGTSKIWVLKTFPHIRVKADYFNKTFSLIDYNIKYK